MAKKKKKTAKNKTSLLSFKAFVLAVGTLALFILFLPTAFLIAVGLLPSFVAAAVDREPGKNKTFTIATMNFAGCFGYILDLWKGANNLEQAVMLTLDPSNIIVMYGAAALGYIINMIVTQGTSSVLIKAANRRLKKIEKEKAALEERWGKKVNGQYELDESGFPLERE